MSVAAGWTQSDGFDCATAGIVLTMNTLASALLAAPHIPHSSPSTSQEWSDARTHLDSPASSTANIEKPPANPTFHETSLSHTLQKRDPSSIPSPQRSHKKSSSIPSPVATRKGHARKLSGIPKSPSVPTFHHHSASADAAPIQNTSLSRTKSNNTITRSPSRKKAPAYHSSYGVETELGPPPSYSTQRTLSQDRVWRVDSRSELAADEDNSRQYQASDTRHIQNEPASNLRPGDLPPGLSPSELISSPETLDTPSIDTPTEEQHTAMSSSLSSYGINIRDDDRGATLKGLGVGQTEDPNGSSSDERRSEDLFLHIARKEAAQPIDLAKAERRRSRISLPFLSNIRPSSHARESGETFDPSLLTPKSEGPQSFNKSSSYGWQNSSASAHPLDRSASNSARSRYLASQPRNAPSVAGSSREVRPRSPESAGPQRRLSGFNGLSASGATSRTQRYVSDSNALYGPKAAATESTISTTAPSTVWDELDDLKSRIKKLELTGKLPTSSAAAMSSMERPRTATTTVTTMSSSPKHNKNIAHMQSAIEGIPSTVHPLLHEALNNVQGAISNDAYQKLQASAHDALQLFSMMGDGDQGNSPAVMGIPPSAQRQIRRRADEMCRNLTELAIALSAEPRSAVSPRPASREALPTVHVPRRMSNEPADRAAIMSRAQSRIESRRTSLRLGENRLGFSSPAESQTQPPPSAVSQTQSASRVQRTATVLRNRRALGYDGAADEEEASLLRPVSRARTDIGRPRVSRDPADFSREYTSQHPMPTPTQYEPRSRMPQNPNPSQLLWRKYGSPASVTGDNEAPSSPITPGPRENFGRISVVGRQSSVPLSSPMEATPENVTIQRGSGGGRRSLGIAGRIGSTVGSRLRAVRAERMNSGARRESDLQQLYLNKELIQDEENRVERQGQEPTQLGSTTMA